MLKKTLFALAGFVVLLGLASPARAASQGVIMTANSSTTFSGIDISSDPASSVVGGTELGWKNICLQNLDTVFSIVCGDSINVSSITTNVNIGTIIAPSVSTTSVSTPTCFPLVENRDFFCRTTKQTGSTRAGRNRIK